MRNYWGQKSISLYKKLSVKFSSWATGTLFELWTLKLEPPLPFDAMPAKLREGMNHITKEGPTTIACFIEGHFNVTFWRLVYPVLTTTIHNNWAALATCTFPCSWKLYVFSIKKNWWNILKGREKYPILPTCMSLWEGKNFVLLKKICICRAGLPQLLWLSSFLLVCHSRLKF